MSTYEFEWIADAKNIYRLRKPYKGWPPGMRWHELWFAALCMFLAGPLATTYAVSSGTQTRYPVYVRFYSALDALRYAISEYPDTPLLYLASELIERH